MKNSPVSRHRPHIKCLCCYLYTHARTQPGVCNSIIGNIVIAIHGSWKPPEIIVSIHSLDYNIFIYLHNIYYNDNIIWWRTTRPSIYLHRPHHSFPWSVQVVLKKIKLSNFLLFLHSKDFLWQPTFLISQLGTENC